MTAFFRISCPYDGDVIVDANFYRIKDIKVELGVCHKFRGDAFGFREGFAIPRKASIIVSNDPFQRDLVFIPLGSTILTDCAGEDLRAGRMSMRFRCISREG